MASVFSKLLGRNLNTAAPVVVFTVPAGHVYIVKWIACYTTAAGQFLEVVHRIGAADFTLESTALGAAFSTLNTERRWVFAAGEKLLTYSFVANVVYVSFYGYDLLA